MCDAVVTRRPLSARIQEAHFASPFVAVNVPIFALTRDGTERSRSRTTWASGRGYPSVGAEHLDRSVASTSADGQGPGAHHLRGPSERPVLGPEDDGGRAEDASVSAELCRDHARCRGVVQRGVPPVCGVERLGQQVERV